MQPEEKMAARLLGRHNLIPPYDLEYLVRNYATIEYLCFPNDADGITVGIGGNTQPQVIINTQAPATRTKFTLAHELGHIIIPWHTGTIVSHLNATDSNSENKYREMEAEANRFAAELLIPKSWLLVLEKSLSTVEDFLKQILTETGASKKASFIKIFNTLTTPIICTHVNADGYLITEYRTNSAPSAARLNEKNLLTEKIFSTFTSTETFQLDGQTYKSWTFDNTGFQETDTRTWREIINQILNETNRRDLLQSINAVLPSKYASNRNKTEQELCSLAMQAYDGRDKYNEIIAHPLFPQYVVKRIKELIVKNKKFL